MTQSTMKNLVLLSIFFCFGLWMQPDHAKAMPAAQYTASDDARVQRDIRIASNILRDLIIGEESSIRSRTDMFSGIYIPDIGVLFQSTNRSLPFVASTGTDRIVVNTNQDVSDQTNTELKIREFFRSYADILSFLSPEESIYVVMHPLHSTHQVVAGQLTQIDSRAGLMMRVKRSDITAFRNGSISESQFDTRTLVRSLGAETPSDINIFVKILETGLSDNESFGPGRNILPILDDDTGLIILTNTRQRGVALGMPYFEIFRDTTLRPAGISNQNVYFNQQFGDSVLIVRGAVLSPALTDTAMVRIYRNNLDSTRVEIRRFNEELVRANQELARAREATVRYIHESNAEIEQMNRELRSRVNIVRPGIQKSEEELQKDLESFIGTVRELLVDYGRTVRSVGSNSKLTVHLNLGQRTQVLPSSVTLSIDKNTLEAFDRRAISRQEAINRVVVHRH